MTRYQRLRSHAARGTVVQPGTSLWMPAVCLDLDLDPPPDRLTLAPAKEIEGASFVALAGANNDLGVIVTNDGDAPLRIADEIELAPAPFAIVDEAPDGSEVQVGMDAAFFEDCLVSAEARWQAQHLILGEAAESAAHEMLAWRFPAAAISAPHRLTEGGLDFVLELPGDELWIVSVKGCSAQQPVPPDIEPWFVVGGDPTELWNRILRARDRDEPLPDLERRFGKKVRRVVVLVGPASPNKVQHLLGAGKIDRIFYLVPR